jgi:hypothetical protein
MTRVTVALGLSGYIPSPRGCSRRSPADLIGSPGVVAVADDLGVLERTTDVRRHDHTDEGTVVNYKGPSSRAVVAHPFEDTGERRAGPDSGHLLQRASQIGDAGVVRHFSRGSCFTRRHVTMPCTRRWH